MTTVPKDIEESCFDAAREALSAGEVPVGCVMIFEDFLSLPSESIQSNEDTKKRKTEFIVKGRNRVNETKNATRHAEFECVDQLVKYFKEKGLPLTKETWCRVTVYVTVEPCVMCARALEMLGVKELFFGCYNLRFGGCGSVYSIHEDQELPNPPLLCHPKSLDADLAVSLLQEFYEGENPNAPEEKAKKKDKKRVSKRGQEDASEHF